MKRCLWLLSVAALFGQSPGELRFEVAAIRKSAGMETVAQQIQQGTLHIGMRINHGSVEIGMLSVYDMVAIAYRVKADQVVSPGWMNAEHWDISAKIPGGESAAQAPEMLASLLRERFKLRMHRETREQNVYALTVDKSGAKMKGAAEEVASAAGGRGVLDTVGGRAEMSADGRWMVISGPSGTVRVSAPDGLRDGLQKLEAASIGMDGLAELMRPLLDRPVVNMTGLTGAYRVEIELSQNDVKALMRQTMGLPLMNEQVDGGDPDARAAALVRGLQPLGLQLKGRKAPVEMIVVDGFEKTPGEN